ncbi:MAG: hypothetical protein LW875_12160 [Proteobacteria bacterium]|nr:hypothetical protein [Pseudomonadota bacterium]
MEPTSLFEIASRSLKENIVETTSGPFLRAGAHQFGSLWTRDFCWASRGLELCGRDDVVDNHLETLLRSAHPQSGLIPRILESGSSAQRVVLHTALRALPLNWLCPKIASPLKPEYFGEHKTPSYDSNSLVLIAAARTYDRASQQKKEQLKEPLQKTLQFLLDQTDQGQQWFEQPAFSDWQDSASRLGVSFYSQVLAVQALRLWSDRSFISDQIWKNLWEILRKSFYHPQKGLFLSGSFSLEQISLEANLLVLDWSLLPEAESKDLWKNLRGSRVWIQEEIPGIPVEPPYKEWQVSWYTKSVGLRGYHDALLWTWLAALAARVAYRCGDEKEARRIFTRLKSICLSVNSVPEILDPNTRFLPFENWLYKSEFPFSWAAGQIIEMMTALGLTESD